jgi:hypothetical protein
MLCYSSHYPSICDNIINILLALLSPYNHEIIGNHQCGFQCKRSTTDQIFCIHQKIEKKLEYNETVHRLFIDFKIFIDFKKGYD